MTEHEKHCVDHCPNCGAEHDGYDELNFYGGEGGTSGVFVRFHCGECGMEYVERYTYDATWYETEGADMSEKEKMATTVMSAWTFEVVLDDGCEGIDFLTWIDYFDWEFFESEDECRAYVERELTPDVLGGFVEWAEGRGCEFGSRAYVAIRRTDEDDAEAIEEWRRRNRAESMIDRERRKAFVEGPLQEAAQVANGYVSYLDYFDEGGVEGVIVVYEDDSKKEVVIEGMSLAAAGAEVLARI